MNKTIKEILMHRDNMSVKDADELILEAKEALYNYLDDGEDESAFNICEEYFGLEPDYLMELM